MKLLKFGVRDDYGKEFYLALFITKRYSLLQVEFDIGEYSSWFESPYLQISMGQGRLFSFLFTISKVGFSFDVAGRNWRDELFPSIGQAKKNGWDKPIPQGFTEQRRIGKMKKSMFIHNPSDEFINNPNWGKD